MTSDQFIARQYHAGLSSKELAEALGYTIRQIRNLRNGVSPINKRTELAMIALTPDYKEIE